MGKNHHHPQRRPASQENDAILHAPADNTPLKIMSDDHPIGEMGDMDATPKRKRPPKTITA